VNRDNHNRQSQVYCKGSTWFTFTALQTHLASDWRRNFSCRLWLCRLCSMSDASSAFRSFACVWSFLCTVCHAFIKQYRRKRKRQPDLIRSWETQASSKRHRYVCLPTSRSRPIIPVSSMWMFQTLPVGHYTILYQKCIFEITNTLTNVTRIWSSIYLFIARKMQHSDKAVLQCKYTVVHKNTIQIKTKNKLVTESLYMETSSIWHILFHRVLAVHLVGYTCWEKFSQFHSNTVVVPGRLLHNSQEDASHRQLSQLQLSTPPYGAALLAENVRAPGHFGHWSIFTELLTGSSPWSNTEFRQF